MSKSEQQTSAPDEMTFEDALEELESIVEQIEGGEIGLEASLAARRRGEALIGRCRKILDKAEQELEQVNPQEQPADEEG